MWVKEANRKKAVSLRKQGFSLMEIAKKVHISKSTASLWVRNTILSDTALQKIEQTRAAARMRAAATHRQTKALRINEIRQSAVRVVSDVPFNVSTDRLLCAVMYWCEGVKMRSKGTMTFINSDPNLVRKFLDLLRSSFSIDESKLRLNVHLHAYHEVDKQLLFWSELTKIPLSQSNKPYRKANTGVRRREGYQGCASIRYHDVKVGRILEAIAIEFLRTK